MSTATAIIGASPVYLAGYKVPGAVQGFRSGASTVVDPRDGGGHQVVGTTRNTGTPPMPVFRRVRLHDQRTGRLLAETWSDAATGAYSFDNIRTGTFYVTAFDHTGAFGGVIETDITPEPMP